VDWKIGLFIAAALVVVVVIMTVFVRTTSKIEVEPQPTPPPPSPFYTMPQLAEQDSDLTCAIKSDRKTGEVAETIEKGFSALKEFDVDKAAKHGKELQIYGEQLLAVSKNCEEKDTSKAIRMMGTGLVLTGEGIEELNIAKITKGNEQFDNGTADLNEIISP